MAGHMLCTRTEKVDAKFVNESCFGFFWDFYFLRGTQSPAILKKQNNEMFEDNIGQPVSKPVRVNSVCFTAYSPSKNKFKVMLVNM